jgi:hypothetical protein
LRRDDRELTRYIIQFKSCPLELSEWIVNNLQVLIFEGIKIIKTDNFAIVSFTRIKQTP